MGLQIVSSNELKSKLQSCGYWANIGEGKYTAVTQVNVPSRKFRGGRSLIISYYDHSLTYICTIHRMTDRKGTVKHEHPKHAVIGGEEYNTA